VPSNILRRSFYFKIFVPANGDDGRDESRMWAVGARSQTMNTVGAAAYMYIYLFFHGATAPSGPGPPHYRGFTIILRHTTLGRTPLDE
jgi:hypothetical protein